MREKIMNKTIEPKTFSKKTFAMALGLGLASAGWAQDSQDSEPAIVGTIVVTGYDSANRDAISTKRNSDGILDAASADQIGLLPDLDVTQVAQRIPGVSVISTFGTNNDRSSDDTDGVVIRGLRPNLNLVTIDGVPIASTDQNDRRTQTKIIPPSVVGRVEAIKTLTADLDPHGLSGQLNLATRSAFDRNRPYLSTRLSLGQNTTAGDVADDHGPDTRADIVFTTQFGSNNQFGLVAAGSFHKLYSTNLEDKPGIRDDTYLIPDEQTGHIASRRNQIFAFQNERERSSGILKFEYHPSSDTDLSIFYGHFKQTDNEDRWEYLANGRENRPLIDSTPTSGTWSEGRLELGHVHQPEETAVDIITAKGSHRFGERSQLRTVLSVSQSEVDTLRVMSKLRPSSWSTDAALSYDISSGRPRLSWVNPGAVQDLSIYESDYIRDRTLTSKQELFYSELNYDWNFDSTSSGWGFNVGVAATLRDQGFDHDYREGDVFNMAGCTEAVITNCPLATMDHFVLPTALPALGSQVPFYLIDGRAFRAAWAALGEPINTDRSAQSIQDDYSMAEDSLAAFGQAVYRGELFTLRGGLRYDRTDIDVALFARDQSLPAQPNGAAQYVAVSRSSDYAFLLPSLAFNYRLNNDVMLRAAYGRTIGRPTFSHYARGESIGVPDSLERSISISRGNPNLKPRISDNFDLSLEYYFDDGTGLLSTALFHKEVQDMIFVRNQIIENFEYAGSFYTARVSQPVNVNDAKISGIEFALRKDLSSVLPALQGFLLNANITLLNGEMTLVRSDGGARALNAWEKQPDFISNIQLAYEKGPFGARLAYNYVDKYINNVDEDDPTLDIFRNGRSEIDLQARYRLNDSLRFVFEIQNLTGENITSVRGEPFEGLLAQESLKGRRYWLGVTWTPRLGN